MEHHIPQEMQLVGVEKVPTNNELINIKEKTRQMLSLIPEGGNFTDIPKDHPIICKGYDQPCIS